MFTEEQRIYKLLCESEKAQLAEQEIILSLQNVGLSLVNNSSSQEVSFIGITRYITSNLHMETKAQTLAKPYIFLCYYGSEYSMVPSVAQRGSQPYGDTEADFFIFGRK